MKKLLLNKLMALSFLCVTYTSLIAMTDNNEDINIQEMLCKARYIKSMYGCLNNSYDNENDCVEIPVSRVAQYIQENEQGDNIFSPETLKMLAFTSENNLIEAYEIAIKNMKYQDC